METARLRDPIVLVHGLLGFDRLQVGPFTIANYFAAIPELLVETGNRVLIARVAPTGGIADRAQDLAAFLQRELPTGRFHIFAHSMGGLDSRHLISRLGLADRVLTLTTIGTPHRGTAFADWGIRNLAGYVRPFLDMLGIPSKAFYDLTTANCQEFNANVPDAPGVRYFSVAGKHQGSWLMAEWELPHRIVLEAEGPNDGVVSVASATYGEHCHLWEGDHVSLVNWFNPLAKLRGTQRDRKLEYAEHVARLVREGF